MSAEQWAKEFARIIKSVLYGMIGWLIVAPISFAFPKRRNEITVIGRFQGEFADNAKYFLLQSGDLLSKDVRVIFITERKDVSAELLRNSVDHYRYPSFRAILCLVRARIVVVDSNEWALNFRRYLLCRAKKIQLWHGVGFKRIQQNKIRNEAASRRWLSLPIVVSIRQALRIVSGRYITYDLLVTTSKFYLDNVFRDAFNSSHFLIAGYPRNTFGKDLLENSATWIGVDQSMFQACEAWMKDSRKIILVTPTFRDTRSTPIGLDPATISMLDQICDEHGFEMIFKFHPFERNTNAIRAEHLHVMESDSDLYPVMPLSSALITDYSSIYTDYTLLDKPIVFFVPDLEEYITKDRQFQFDYSAMTPGPKAETWEEVMNCLIAAFTEDSFANDRKAIRKLAFDNLDQMLSTQKVLQFAANRNWLPEAQLASTRAHAGTAMNLEA